MRSTDAPQPPWRPLGEKVTPAAPAAKPEWKPAPGAAPGIEVGPNGRLRTNLPLPK